MAEKILVVEDEVDICKIMQIMLQDSGYEVICAYSVPEALELLEKKEVDLAIIDFIFKGDERRGTEVAKFIKENLQGVPVLLFTAYLSDPKNPEFAIFNGVIGKPFQIECLLAMIREKLEH